MKVEPAIETLMQKVGSTECRPLPFGKFLLKSAANKSLIKAAASPRGRVLLRNEALGIRQLSPALGDHLRVPTVNVLHDDETLCALEFSSVRGTQPRSWGAPHHDLEVMLNLEQRETNLRDVLVAERVERDRIETLLDRHGNPGVPMAPSHGDYIYWNLLCAPNAKPGLIDFEYYSPARLSFYDDLHFRVAPWLWRLIRLKMPLAALRKTLQFFIKDHHTSLSNELVFDLFVVHWMQIANWIYRSDPDANDHQDFPRLTIGPRLLDRS